jgi:hypothetical protein
MLSKTEILNAVKQPIPKNMGIVPLSVPLLYYGNYEKANACTVGINPGPAEFTTNTRKHTDGKHPVSRKTLGFKDSAELTTEAGNKVIQYCTAYFSDVYKEVNQDEKWFKALEAIAQQFYPDYSYSKGTLVHADIVGWSTEKGWGGLDKDIKTRLISASREQTKKLLDNKNFKYIFLNGSAVANTVIELLNLSPKIIPLSFSYTLNGKKRDKTGRLFLASYKTSSVIGWSLFVGDADRQGCIGNSEKNRPNVIQFGQAIKKKTGG